MSLDLSPASGILSLDFFLFRLPTELRFIRVATLVPTIMKTL